MACVLGYKEKDPERGASILQGAPKGIPKADEQERELTIARGHPLRGQVCGRRGVVRMIRDRSDD